MRKILLLVLGLTLSAPMITDAQPGKGNGKAKGHGRGHGKGHAVKVKPKAPKYTKVVSPGNNYVYVNEDWTWDPGANQWVWNGNRWVVVPASQTWVPGRWVSTRLGWDWVPGYWR